MELYPEMTSMCINIRAGPVGYPFNITAVLSVSVSSVLMCTDIRVSVLDRRYFRYMGFGIFTINLPWLDVCICCGRRGFFYAKHRHPALGNKR